MKILFLSVFCLTFSMKSFCANIVWNAAFVMMSQGSGGGEADITLGAPPYLPMTGSRIDDGWLLFALPYSYMEYANCFVLSSLGDVVGQEYFSQEDRYFLYSEFGDENSGRSDYSISVLKDAPVYLAFRHEDDYGTNYGWVMLGLGPSGDVESIMSGWDKDGNPMLVGVIPEPDSVLLIFIGLLVLVMRRSTRIARGLSPCVLEVKG